MHLRRQLDVAVREVDRQHRRRGLLDNEREKTHTGKHATTTRVQVGGTAASEGQQRTRVQTSEGSRNIEKEKRTGKQESTKVGSEREKGNIPHTGAGNKPPLWFQSSGRSPTWRRRRAPASTNCATACLRAWARRAHVHRTRRRVRLRGMRDMECSDRTQGGRGG